MPTISIKYSTYLSIHYSCLYCLASYYFWATRKSIDIDIINMCMWCTKTKRSENENSGLLYPLIVGQSSHKTLSDLQVIIVLLLLLLLCRLHYRSIIIPITCRLQSFNCILLFNIILDVSKLSFLSKAI